MLKLFKNVKVGAKLYIAFGIVLAFLILTTVFSSTAFMSVRSMVSQFYSNTFKSVELADEIDLKLEMLECHESQLKWMRDHDNLDFADFVSTLAKFRGYQCGVPYAEAFRQELAWPKLVAARLLP